MHRIYKFLKFMGKMLRLTVFFVLFLICGAEAQATSKLSNSVCYAYMETCVHKIENLVTTLKDESCRGSCQNLPLDCKEIMDCDSSAKSGVYKIYNPIDGEAEQVYCDMETDGGGWMVFQRRINGNVSFMGDWDRYRFGFGEVTGNFWLGNEMLYRLTNYKKQQLRVELEKWDGKGGFMTYEKFIVGSSDDNFRLNIDTYHGNIGDSLKTCHNGQQFSTPENDNDPSSRNCAGEASSGWWFCNCEASNLNGIYYDSGQVSKDWLGISWDTFGGQHYSYRKSEMKIRPL